MNQIDEFNLANNYIPGGISRTNLLTPPNYGPCYLVEGFGSKVRDMDNKIYIDYLMGFGAIILGHSVESINTAIIDSIRKSNFLGYPNPIQNDVAKEIINIIPSAEKVKFFRSGSSACSAAIRLARLYTGKRVILTCGYHGWNDQFAKCLSINGIPDEISEICVDFNYSYKMLNYLFNKYQNDVAGVVIEPDLSIHDEKLLFAIKNLCKKNAALFILDEVKTGFRVAIGGVQELYNIEADISIFSKALANGYPLACVLGKRDIMDYFNYTLTDSTHDTETTPYIASLETIKVFKQNDVLQKIHNLGSILMNQIEDMIINLGVNAKIKGHVSAPCIIFDNILMQKRFTWEMIKRGILLCRDRFNISYSHTEEDIEKTLHIVNEVLPLVGRDLYYELPEEDVKNQILINAGKEKYVLNSNWKVVKDEKDIFLRNKNGKGTVNLNDRALGILNRLNGEMRVEDIWKMFNIDTCDIENRTNILTFLRKLHRNKIINRI